MRKHPVGLAVERLEKRDVPGTVQGVNPGNAEAAWNSGNVVGAFSAGVTGNGDLVSEEAMAGWRNEIVQFYLSLTDR